MAKSLVIVESPAKARTISRLLGDDYVVESSIGHIRDLPSKASEMPAAYRSKGWKNNWGVNPDDGFKPLYVVPPPKKQQVQRLRSLLRDADRLYLATDEDREGEAIAWHLIEVLNPQMPVHRMVFHEITAAAIQEAIDHPRDLDRRLVDAQEARRIFDRLYGYEVSPVLWKKVAPKLSAGRVQSVANRLIVERERERMAFRSAAYWSVTATLDAASAPAEGATGDGGSEAAGSDRAAELFDASLVSVNERRIAQGRDFDQQGELRTDGLVVLDADAAGSLTEALTGAPFTVASREAKPYRRRPQPPFITSTLQQAAGARLGFSAARTMAAAQRLYENGRITYMRTDSTTLSDQALDAARRLVRDRYGSENLPSAPRIYTRKVKNAQEAHEAIRPAGDSWSAPGSVNDLGGDAARVYDLVWQRTVASQMIDATGETVTIRLVGTAECELPSAFAPSPSAPAVPAPASAGAPSHDAGAGRHHVELSASGTVVLSPGFRLAYAPPPTSADADRSDDEPERLLPDLAAGDEALAVTLEPSAHHTNPPARYGEASLVRRLEELGVGRPSTYASIIETIQTRGYVWKKGSSLVPTFTALVTVGLMERHFDHLVDYALTARMEEDLDEIANGQREAQPWLHDFYFGESEVDAPQAADGLRHLVSDGRLAVIDPAEINAIPVGTDEEGEPVIAKLGRYGPYLRRGESICSLPEGLAPDELTLERALALLDEPTDRVVGTDPDTGLDIIVQRGRYGPYISLGRVGETDGKPRTASLLSSQTPETLTLDDALMLLSLPRTVGMDPSDGQQIVVRAGRYGPYLTKGEGKQQETRSLESEEQLFTLTLDEALALLAQPRRRRGQTAAKPGREIGTDPDSGKPMVLKDGRYGQYVTDGEYNATLQQGDDADSLTIERAAELLAMRRAKGPAKKRAAKKSAAKKGPAKKGPAKKSAATKRAAKKSAATKAPAKKRAAKKRAAKSSA
ncbi:type I DNA topoisomerase [Candidatus Poriferisodalis sp.]|uniref:type I DNA topoisomerase n=1 Tax=Candidatus Poriferisodalis sp. TaxID=3101277 RepID=UPI003B02D6A4